MKKFVMGFLTALLLSATTFVYATTYSAQTASFPIFINGKQFISDKPILAIEGSTYLPLKAIGEALGINVQWNTEMQRVDIGDTSVVAKGYSRNNPAPLNEIQTISVKNWGEEYTADVRVESVLRGDSAWRKIKEANMFNDVAPAGKEYVLAKIVVSCSHVKDDAALSVSDYDFTCFSGNNEEYKNAYVVEPEPKLDAKIYAGASTSGYVTFLVNKDDTSPKVVFGENYDGTGGIWFKLYQE